MHRDIFQFINTILPKHLWITRYGDIFHIDQYKPQHENPFTIMTYPPATASVIINNEKLLVRIRADKRKYTLIGFLKQFKTKQELIMIREQFKLQFNIVI